jgi:hypothetical protein
MNGLFFCGLKGATYAALYSDVINPSVGVSLLNRGLVVPCFRPSCCSVCACMHSGVTIVCIVLYTCNCKWKAVLLYHSMRSDQ